MEFLRKIDPEDVKGKYVIEFGSLNVNGSAREVIEPMKPRLYVGYDACEGPGVDIVVDVSIPANWTVDAEKPEVVICLNTLEHIKNWVQVVFNMKALLKRGGILAFAVPSPGFMYHNPPDYWRFTLEQVAEMFSDMKTIILEKDTMIPGVLFLGRAQAKTGEGHILDIHPMMVPQPKTKVEDWDNV